ncbi:uncharacterized protein LOC115224193 isoform X2 [Octopus sinensis]|uniref:Uncharacterized protein LOC115224193 isoform X2 n=1 Tax=Octopus sinensis TaxID=2607531 RepID=A0A7E6FNY0_9MOLL|nr:uncharacterized protein LOC115224193 isoform X2 [Octopus sinensis]
MADSDRHTTPLESAIYHGISPRKISFLICLVQGHVRENSSPDYLLACNLVMSSLVACAVAWWYRSGDLAPDKYWFLLVVGAVILFQCLTTDIYVFHKQITIAPTVAPITTTPK